MPGAVSAQLIFDFGIGPEAGVVRLGSAKNNYYSDSNPYGDFKTKDHFSMKAPIGMQVGFRLMSCCTLTTPDRQLFYTATCNAQFLFGSFNAYYPDFQNTSAMHNPPIEWKEPVPDLKYYGFTYSFPLLFTANYQLQSSNSTVYFGLGVSYNKLICINDGRWDRMNLRVVADDQSGLWCTTYVVEYDFKPFVVAEFQPGIIWENVRGGQTEVFLNGSIGAGMQGAVRTGILWRFNFYKGD